ncbi:MAG: DUF11 domain-containing protein, partial [Clostridiales bacterium]|nr:DUF11 domain-containing protein [Clostridiales bacterium]
SYDTTVTVDGVKADVTETFDSTAGVKYHTVTFTLDEDDTDKNIAVAVTNQEEEITITEDNLNLFLNGIKYLANDDTEAVGEMNFTYSIYDGSNTLVATGTVTTEETAANTTSTNNITWWTISDPDAFTYTEVGTYTYTIIENVTANSGIVYDTARYNLVVTVSKDEDGGGLIAEATLVKYENNTATSDVYDTILVATTDESYVPTETLTVDWTNTYDPSDASIILRAYKNLEGRTLTAGEFSAIVTEYDDETYSGTGTVIGTQTNGANGYMSLEIVYDEDDAGIDGTGTFVAESTGSQGVSSYGTLSKIHYYTVTEAIPDGATDNGDGTYTYNSVTYDATTYYVKVTVSVEARQTASGNYLTYERTGAVTVSSAEYSTDGDTWTSLFAYNDETKEYDEVNLTFTNTYEGTGYGTLSTYKVMEGRTFNAGETFTFTITALDSAAPTLTDPGNGVEFKDNGDGTYTVTVTVPSSAAGDSILNEVLASFDVDQDDVGEWVYRVTETSASVTNGMTLDSATYGHLITVYVTDDGDGTMTVTTESTNDTDWNGDGETDTTSSVIVNTYNPGIKTIYGTKVWVDGGLSHDNSSEVTLTLFYSTNGKTWYNYTDDYTVTWGTANTSDWHIAGLPIYDESSNKLYYQVVETYTNGNSYTTTYGADESSDPETIPEDNSSTNRYTITNTIKQDYMTISGTKTWVEPVDETTGEAPTHVNADELVLTVTRNSETTDLTTLSQVSGDGTGADDTYIVVWDGDAYSIYWYKDSTTGEYMGLPVYDASGYTYYYNVAESYNTENTGDAYNDYTIETDWELVSDTEVTFDFTNRAPNDDDVDPVKTEDESVYGEGTEATVNGQTVVEYGDVAVGDQITYTISYYNNANTTATVRITDPLDSGVDYVSSDPTGTYNESTHTVTWEIETEAFTHGSVTVTVKVNSSARSIVSGETAATVDNQATVYNTKTSHTATTEIVTNSLEDDEDEETTKGIISVTYEDEEGNEYTRTETDGTNVYVQEGDQIHYIISRYNNTNESATFVIVDTLDEGVTYTYSSVGSTYYDTATTVTVGSESYSIPARSVVWIVSTNPYSYATVQMTVSVNSSAKTATQTYDATVPGTYDGESDAEYTGYAYGVNNTTASVANQAVAYTVGNTTVSYSMVIENPLEPDDPVVPVKSEPYRTATDGLDEDGNVEDTNGENGISDETVTYETVGIGALVEYEISYYNHNNTAATVTITDTLDENMQFVDASDSGTYDAATHTVTWTIENVTPLTSGSVTVQVQVLSSAGDAQSISNQASVQIGNDTAVSTNTVENPVDDEPEDPQKEVSDDSAAGVDGDNVQVGDEITYEITYYNHNSEAATITIVDTLDENVELVDATDKDGNSLYATPVAGAVAKFVDNLNGTVTWTFTAEAYETGTVTITVRVLEGAKGGTVTNQASVQVGNDTAVDTNVSENPVDDDPEDPVKTETDLDGVTPTGTIDGVTVTDATVISSDDTIVYDDTAVGDEITYTISYYNHYGDTANVTITDSLDSGVTYVSSSDNGVYTSNTRTVTWTIENVAAYAEGTVTLTVRVNSSAKTITVGETEATVDNQATVTITEEENTTSNTTNVVVNPLEDDDPTDPTKTETSVLDDSTGTTSTAHATDSVTEEDGTTYVTYGEVGVGDQIAYRLSYTNHMNGIATITITDVRTRAWTSSPPATTANMMRTHTPSPGPSRTWTPTTPAMSP